MSTACPLTPVVMTSVSYGPDVTSPGGCQPTSVSTPSTHSQHPQAISDTPVNPSATPLPSPALWGALAEGPWHNDLDNSWGAPPSGQLVLQKSRHALASVLDSRSHARSGRSSRPCWILLPQWTSQLNSQNNLAMSNFEVLQCLLKA